VGGNHKTASIMKIYISMLALLAFLFWNQPLILFWLLGFSVFIPITYGKDFIDKRMR
jgi:hypothetical protein